MAGGREAKEGGAVSSLRVSVGLRASFHFLLTIAAEDFVTGISKHGKRETKKRTAIIRRKKAGAG